MHGGPRAILTALLCPDRSPLSHLTPPPFPLLSSDHNRQILQHILPREISTESFTHLLFLLCPLSSSVSPALYTLSLCSPLPLPSVSLSIIFYFLFFCCYRYRARVEKVESPAKVHVFYIDYGNVSNFVTMNLTDCVRVCTFLSLSLNDGLSSLEYKTKCWCSGLKTYAQ